MTLVKVHGGTQTENLALHFWRAGYILACLWRAGCKGWLWLAVIWHVTGAKRNPSKPPLTRAFKACPNIWHMDSITRRACYKYENIKNLWLWKISNPRLQVVSFVRIWLLILSQRTWIPWKIKQIRNEKTVTFEAPIFLTKRWVLHSALCMKFQSGNTNL